ncbi:MAG: glycosyltransferase family 2 protein, partial [Chitinophagaceae bacterium]
MNTDQKTPTLLISIVICTYNNSKSLGETLESFIAQKNYDAEKMELLIIDNNSSDDTKDIVQAMIPRIACKTHYIFEEKQGLSNARNAGINNAMGEYILFTDDDAELPDNWLQKYAQQINTYSPDCIFSKIEVIWDKPKPW